jgi:hypothetical protein
MDRSLEDDRGAKSTLDDDLGSAEKTARNVAPGLRRAISVRRCALMPWGWRKHDFQCLRSSNPNFETTQTPTIWKAVPEACG